MTSSIDGTPLLVDEELSGAGTHINSVAQTIMDELDALMVKVQYLQENWKGWSPTYFDPLMQQWTNAAKGLFAPAEQGGVLGEIAAAMNVSWNNYADAEQANVSTWSSAG